MRQDCEGEHIYGQAKEARPIITEIATSLAISYEDALELLMSETKSVSVANDSVETSEELLQGIKDIIIRRAEARKRKDGGEEIQKLWAEYGFPAQKRVWVNMVKRKLGHRTNDVPQAIVDNEIAKFMQKTSIGELKILTREEMLAKIEANLQMAILQVTQILQNKKVT